MTRRSGRTCYAYDCNYEIRASDVLFCRVCWRSVPRRIRRKVWEIRDEIEAHAQGESDRDLDELFAEWVAAMRTAREVLAKRRKTRRAA